MTNKTEREETQRKARKLATELHKAHCGYCEKGTCDWPKRTNWKSPSTVQLVFLDRATTLLKRGMKPAEAVKAAKDFAARK